MKELVTIQKREKLNKVFVVGDKGPGGANHEYTIQICNDKTCANKLISFQKGPRKETESMHGIIDSDLLEIVRDRITSFQQGEFASRENAIVLTHIEEALMWMNQRVENRIERNVLGTYNK
jgi:hypothetical protein